MLYCQILLHKNRKSRLIKKRSTFMIKVGSTAPGFLAWLNLVVTLDVGAPCWFEFVLAVLVAPLSIGPQLTRAINLWSMYQLSHLLLKQDVISTRDGNRFEPIKEKSEKTAEGGGPDPQRSTSAAGNAVRAHKIKLATKWGMNFSIWGLLVLPTTALLILTMLLPTPEELAATDHVHCSDNPPLSIKILSPALGMFVAILAISSTILLRNSPDELGIRHEIFRNICIWAVSAVLLIVMRALEVGWVQVRDERLFLAFKSCFLFPLLLLLFVQFGFCFTFDFSLTFIPSIHSKSPFVRNTSVRSPS